MCNCKWCGKEIDIKAQIYAYPIYDLDIENKTYTSVKAHVFCWECFSSFARAINLAILSHQNPKISETCHLNNKDKK
jgi:hypothetical protein